jgi:lysozyme
MKISNKGLAFIAGHEGFVSSAYRDPVGVLTIGYGFTMRSRVFAAWWRERYGRALKMGDKISRADADSVLRALISEEYGAAVTAYFGDLPQHQYDAASSVAFNLGPGAVKWRWGRALKEGLVTQAAAILRNNYNTATVRDGLGRKRRVKLPGLVRRRKEEAHLLKAGEYIGVDNVASPVGKTDAVDQMHEDRELLAKLGYDSGDFNRDTLAFQRANHPPLVVDGIFGPATRATAKRVLSKKATKKTTGAAGVAAGGGAAVTVAEKATEIDWTSIAVGLGTGGAIAVLAYVAWINRGNIWNSLPEWLQGRLASAVGDA